MDAAVYDWGGQLSVTVFFFMYSWYELENNLIKKLAHMFCCMVEAAFVIVWPAFKRENEVDASVLKLTGGKG